MPVHNRKCSITKTGVCNCALAARQEEYKAPVLVPAVAPKLGANVDRERLAIASEQLKGLITAQDTNLSKPVGTPKELAKLAFEYADALIERANTFT